MNLDITQTEQFVFFWRGWPSQWYPAPFVLEGIHYTCCEQYMMAEKARVFADVTIREQILKAASPREQKALGRKIHNFDEQKWTSVCRDIVYAANLAKFTQNPELRTNLLDTGSRIIVEASPVDSIWGIGLAVDDPAVMNPAQWRGTNWLGISLMQVRDTIRNQGG